MTEQFTEVYDTRTGLKQRVPAEWLGDPVLGRFIKKTASQRALDGELGPAPTDDSTIAEIRGFAKDAEIDVTGLTRKDDLLAAVRAVVGTEPLPEPATPGVDVETPTGVTDPTDMVPVPQTPDGATGPAEDSTTDPTTTDTPAAGD